ncbi:hypothetical protein Patl1_25259 [Pistacia atlantica]|uniref:Uncharacterized protein n=1 Tax=Pistacia atlantica TaxID=434234 RepID=A0ACC1AZ46_9ROSI|nr:hypothetical protein Patl1_25259 [Pistacia atlantica]
MSSLGTSKGILEIAKFGLYVSVPIFLMYTFANNTKNIQKGYGQSVLRSLSPGGTKASIARGTEGDGSRTSPQEQHSLNTP